MNSILRLRSPRLRWGNSSSGFASAAANNTNSKAWASQPTSGYDVQDESQEEVVAVEADVQYDPEPAVEVVVGTKSYVFPPSRGLRPNMPVKLSPGHYQTPRLPIHIPPKQLRQKSWKPMELKQQHLANESPKSVLRRIRKELNRRREQERAESNVEFWDDDIASPEIQEQAGEDSAGWNAIAALELHPTSSANVKTNPSASSSSSSSVSPTQKAGFPWENKPSAGLKSPIQSPFRGFFTGRRLSFDENSNSKSSETTQPQPNGDVINVTPPGNQQRQQHQSQQHVDNTMIEFHNSHENPHEMMNHKVEVFEEIRGQQSFASASPGSGTPDEGDDDDLP